MKKLSLLSLSAMLFALPCRAERYSVTSPDFFLDSASGARALAMGTAQTAVAEGSSALYWNPAVLGQPARDSASAGYSKLFGGASVSDAGLFHSFNAPFGAALAVAHYSITDAVERDALNNVTGSFGDRRTAVLGGAGFQYSRSLYFGAAGRFITQSMAGESASAFAADAGALYSSGILRVGAAAQNLVAGSLSRSGGSDTLPLIFRAGVGVNIIESLLVSADVVHRNPGNTTLLAGAEFRPLDMLALRGGYNGDFLTMGAGISAASLELNYAVIKQEILGFSHRVSLTFSFGPPASEKRSARGN